MTQIGRRQLLLGSAMALIALPIGGWSPLFAATASVRNDSTGASFDTLTAALTAARPGDILTVTGTHRGNFTLDKPLTLTGDGVLDGGGTGTVLTITADDVNVSALTLKGSGRRAEFNVIWGPAGIRVEGDRARLSGLTITGNDVGILLLGAADAVVTMSRSEDNFADGVNVMGGRGHHIALNEINRNGVGITVGPRYGDATVMIMPETGDTEAMQRLNEMKEAAEGPQKVTIDGNELRGNGTIGIHLYTRAKACVVKGNEVHRTGREREPDRAATAWYLDYLSRQLGGVEIGDEIGKHVGSGIWLSCDTYDHHVVANHSHDNLGMGIAANMTYRTLFERNTVDGNASGIWLNFSDDNELRANRVADNTDYGIIIDNRHGYTPAASGSSGNLVVLNTMFGNRVNAYDSSDHVPTRAEVEAWVADAPLFGEQFRQVCKSNPGFLDQTVQSFLDRHEPGRNSWDNGSLGNHCDDFDEPPEGFRDADGDGIGEAVHAIPGGGHVDHFPLTADRVALELEEN